MEEKILVIDDSPTMIEILVDLLSSNNYKVVTAMNGHDGIQEAIRFEPDLIILDVVLPDINGWEVCKTLRKTKQTRDIPIIMQTGAMVRIEHEIKSFDYGADDYITKPYDTQVLISRIQAIINRSHKKEVSEILKVGMSKIIASVVVIVAINAIAFWATFRFVMSSSQLGRYADAKMGDIFPKLNLLFGIEGLFFLFLIVIVVFLFLNIINKRLNKLEELILRGRPEQEDEA
ncbi:response regulator transcription factor [Elusimicrobiota bacterium]